MEKNVTSIYARSSKKYQINQWAFYNEKGELFFFFPRQEKVPTDLIKRKNSKCFLTLMENKKSEYCVTINEEKASLWIFDVIKDDDDKIIGYNEIETTLENAVIDTQKVLDTKAAFANSNGKFIIENIYLKDPLYLMKQMK